MTLEQVMALDGRELDAAVAEQRLGWKGPVVWIEDDPYLFPPDPVGYAAYVTGDRGWDCIVPRFHDDWSAAMRIRDWARGLDHRRQQIFALRLLACLTKRLGHDVKVAILLDVEPVDLARAALLVSP